MNHVRNVTVSLDDETSRWVRIAAAVDDLSVSKWLSELIERERSASDRYDEATDSFLARVPHPLNSGGDEYSSRSASHERSAKC